MYQQPRGISDWTSELWSFPQIYILEIFFPILFLNIKLLLEHFEALCVNTIAQIAN